MRNQTKPKIAKLSDQIAQYFVATILLTTIITAWYWQQHLLQEAFWITLSVLVATCPCALSLATPTALTCATTRLNKSGILVKSGHVLETLPKADYFAFDKTGTLTLGEFKIDKLVSYSTLYTDTEIFAIAAALEAHSEHPIAKAFNSYRDHTLKVTNVSVFAGSGISGKFNNHLVKIGKPKWLLSPERLFNNQALSSSQCVLIIDNELIAAFYLTDKVRNDANELVSQLAQANILSCMVSGDNPHGCHVIQEVLKLNHVYSQLSPTDKINQIKKLQKNHTVIMVGDGINDTPVFGAAHVSIAMGCGADIAKSGADVILLNNQLTSITILRKVAIKTKQIIWQNYIWAFGYNAIALPLAVTGHVTPYMAVIGMSLSSILVVTNSLRLLKVKGRA